MKNRVLWIVVSGFASFMTLGATGAAADSYVSYTTSINTQQVETHQVVCNTNIDESEYALTGEPNCSVHRVYATYGRQKMASSMARDHAFME